MAETVLMPQVGQDIKTARIVDWLKKENQEVKKGEVIAVVESDKAAFDVEAYTSGVLLKILHPEGQEVEVLTPIAYIGQPGEPIEDARQRPAPGPAGRCASGLRVGGTEDRGQTTEVVGSESAIRHPPSAIQERMAVSPSARRLAQEKGINLATVQGTGPGGRVTKEDILAAARRVPVRAYEETPHDVTASRTVTSPAGTLEDTVIVFTPMRARIAQRLTRSKQTIPHFYISVDVDMSEALSWRQRFTENRQTKATITDMIVKAAATALSQYARMNAHVEQDKIILKRAINVGVAVSVDEGLIVPVIADADKKSLGEISSAARENAAAARAGRLKPQALGSFTVTNLGMFAVDTFVPVINPPEAAILAVGRVAERPVVVDGAVVPRRMMTVTLSCDHRVVDGATGALFLQTLTLMLENPLAMLL